MNGTEVLEKGWKLLISMERVIRNREVRRKGNKSRSCSALVLDLNKSTLEQCGSQKARDVWWERKPREYFRQIIEYHIYHTVSTCL